MLSRSTPEQMSPRLMCDCSRICLIASRAPSGSAGRQATKIEVAHGSLVDRADGVKVGSAASGAATRSASLR